MEGEIDEISGRPLIEGRGSPINGGIFRCAENPGLIVDKKYFDGKPWFTEDCIIMSSIKTDMLKIALYIASKRMPINDSHFEKVVSEKHNRYSLSNFVSQLGVQGEELGGGNADVQALYVAFLIEQKIGKYPDRKVWIKKDPDDGHATVQYEGITGKYSFDPKEDKSFLKTE